MRIAGHKARRDAQRAAEGDAEMGEIAAHAARFSRLSSAVVSSSLDPGR